MEARRISGATRRTVRLPALVTLATAVGMALGVPSAGAAAIGGSHPAVAVDPSNQAQFVFWQATNGDLWESYRYARWRGPVNVTSRYGLGPTNAPPTVAVASDDQEYLFWRGPNGLIHEGHHTSRWRTYSFPSWGAASSQPAVGVDPRSNHQYVFWRGRDRHTHEAYYNGDWHCCQDFVSWGQAASPPAVGVADDEQQYVFWEATGGRVREAHHTNRWSVRTLGWRTSDAPAVAVNPVTNHQYVFWRDTSGHTTESWYPQHNGGWWPPHEMRGWPSALGSPSAAVADDDQQYVFWQTPAGHIDEAHHTTRWSRNSFPRWKPAVIPTKPTPYCTAQDLGIHLETTRGAAGSAYRDFGFVNVTSHACRLKGYPGVSALTARGSVVDLAAGHRSGQSERPVVIAPGDRASFSLATSDVGPSCLSVVALRFIPPNDRHYEQIALHTRLCGGRAAVSPVESRPPPL